MEQRGGAPSERVQQLLLKNVGKETPLDDDELQELKEFRLEISDEEWSHWLKQARKEKKRQAAERLRYLEGNSPHLPPDDELKPEQSPPQPSRRPSAPLVVENIGRLTSTFMTDPFDDADPDPRVAPRQEASQGQPLQPANPIMMTRVEELASRASTSLYVPSQVAPEARPSSSSQDMSDGVSLSRPQHSRSRSAPRAGMSAPSSAARHVVPLPPQSTGMRRQHTPAPSPSLHMQAPQQLPEGKLTRVVTDHSPPHLPPAPPTSAPEYSQASSIRQLSQPATSAINLNALRVALNEIAAGDVSGTREQLTAPQALQPPAVQVGADPRELQEVRAALQEASALAHAGRYRVEAAYQAAQYLLQTAGRSESQEVLVELLSCLDQARSSLQHLTETTDMLAPVPERSAPQARAAGPLHAHDLLSDAQSDIDDSFGYVDEQPRQALTNYKPTSPWRSLLRDRPGPAAAPAERHDISQAYGAPHAAPASPEPLFATDILPSALQRDRIYAVQQTAVVRICLVQGPLAKAFEEFPIRADLESSTVDVVWREPREAATNPLASKVPHYAAATAASRKTKAPFGSTHSEISSFAPACTLRRERFSFDAVLAGTKAVGRLRHLIRQNMHNSLAAGMGLVCICTGCGEADKLEVEPPVTLALGSAGGSGVVSAMLDEIFRFTGPPSGDGAAAEYAAINAATQRKVSRVAFSAVLVQGAKVVDLLHTGSSADGAFIKFDKQTRHASLRNATWVDLQSTLDFERIVGLLLGRRTGLLEALTSGSAISRDFTALATWDHCADDASTQSAGGGSRRGQRVLASDLRGMQGADTRSTVLVVSIAVTCTPMYSRKPVRTVYRVTAPCGQNWTQPGFDLNALSEVLGSLPHDPPVGILQASPLTALLTDAATKHSTSYLSILSVNRRSPARPNTPSKYSDNGEGDYGAAGDLDMAAAAVQALRIASLPK